MRITTDFTRKPRPKGSIVPPFTAFNKTGDIDFNILPSYIKHLKRYGVPSIFVNGTTGEGMSLSVKERMELAEAYMDNRQHLESIVMHIGTGNLKETIQLARHAQSINADAIACISPSYYKPHTVDALVEYMRLVALEAPAIPFFLYDISQVTGIFLNLEDFLAAAKSKIPTLVGMKHSSPEMSSLMRCHRVCGGKYQILFGSDDALLPALSMGVSDTVPMSFMAPLHNKIRESYAKGDLVSAQDYQYKCMQIDMIRNKYAPGVGWVSVSKAIMSMLGLELGPPRLPLEPLSKEKFQQLEADLRKYKFFDLIESLLI